MEVVDSAFSKTHRTRWGTKSVLPLSSALFQFCLAFCSSCHGRLRDHAVGLQGRVVRLLNGKNSGEDSYGKKAICILAFSIKKKWF